MSNTDTSLHLYRRTVSVECHDSLSVIAQLIEPGQTLLDLGMGTGGLGQYLRQRQATVADGVTLNQAEADIARAWYRRAVVADLDCDRLSTLLGNCQYDCIVCADVLEHLKAPQNLLAQCKALLRPGGRLITSTPNAGYCGLVAELMQGDFRYRSEGLLDNTHLRFFTRISLQRFFDEHGWSVQAVNPIQRRLPDSEFRVTFDSLPPAVARHLLATPDALTYQFVCVLQPVESIGQVLLGPTAQGIARHQKPEPVSAHFSTALYLAVEGQFDEAVKLVSTGRIGESRQTLIFDIAASPNGYTHVRIDPADRPGFFRLHHLRIKLPDGHPVWQWEAQRDPLATLADARHNQIVFSSPWELASGALLLLHGDDPWVELPLAPGLLKTIAKTGARLEACVDWPMSADYLQASATINQLQATQQQSVARLQQEVERLTQQVSTTESSRLELQAQLKARLQDARAVQDEKRHLTEELRTVDSKRLELQERVNQAILQLQTIESSTVFRATRPLVQLKMSFDRLTRRVPKRPALTQSSTAAPSLPVSRHPVDIIVPVYRDLDNTRCCLESVLGATCQTGWRLIVINDESPEPEVTDWLRVFAQRDPRIVLLENAENLGFVASVNRGMALSQDNDVLLLNSDTEVANDWLDRIQRAAYSAPRIGSVTPFSNNATICSYPRFCQANELPSGYNTASLDRLFAQQLAGQSVEVPTGVGFCMYIRRQCLKQVGFFDVANFGRGYGEENDFCVRAQLVGWTHLHALDTFVRHAGGVSFGGTKSERELFAMETLRRLHPNYERDVHDYVQRDPAQASRLSIDLARITADARPVIVSVIHNRDGGTLRHVQELAQQLGGQATFLRLSPAPGGMELRLEGSQEAFALHFALPQEHASLLQTLRRLKVSHIHYHHLLDHALAVCELPAQLGVSHDFTAHDYYSYCPQISLTDHNDRYCCEQGVEQCHQCLQRNPAPDGESIESWRQRHARLLSQARYVITPSFDTAQRMQRFVPAAHIQVVPHSSLQPQSALYPKPHPRVLASGQRLKIVVLGALSRIKGADTLEEVSTLSAIHNVDLEFHLLGYPYRDLRALPNGLLTVHGAYQDKDLPQLLQSLQADAAWFPALWPETYSYTLSACLQAGLPVVAPNLGAFAERLQNREWTWLCDWYQSVNQWLDFFKLIRQEHFCKGASPSHIPAFTPPMLQAADANSPVLFYQNNYLDQLPQRGTSNAHELIEMRQGIDAHQHSSTDHQASTAIKLAPLRTLLRLPKRLESWLGK